VLAGCGGSRSAAREDLSSGAPAALPSCDGSECFHFVDDPVRGFDGSGHVPARFAVGRFLEHVADRRAKVVGAGVGFDADAEAVPGDAGGDGGLVACCMRRARAFRIGAG
jgi:hypothetical protein